ncbi:MAG: DUF1576 domain-containing protein, partial [Defluviitaleaceae bacterium]|nr:DUF1576 domain-containing protein [Defluviitaleaceae bacterium]
MYKYHVYVTKTHTPYKVWGLLMALTLVYGLVLSFTLHGGDGLVHVAEGLWRIVTSPALLTHDYVDMVGVGPAFVNAGLSGLFILAIFKFAKLPASGPQMAAFGLVMGFALMGKNPVNMFPILLGAYLYSLYSKQEFKTLVTFAAYSTCLAPIISQPAHIPQIVDAVGVWGGITLGGVLGVFLGFIINSMATFIRKSHEGLNLYNVGWGAGLLAIALTAVYNTLGVVPFSYHITGYLVQYGQYNFQLYGYLVLITIYFMIISLLLGGRLKSIKQILTLNAADSKYVNNFYAKYGPGTTYMAMSFLGMFILAVTLAFGVVNLNGLIVAASISIIGWGGFGKAVANAAAIVGGVLLGAFARYIISPNFFRDGVGFFEYFSTQSVIWTSAFWGTCLSPMARFFGW